MDKLKNVFRLVFLGLAILLISPLLLGYIFIEAIQFIGRHGIMPVYYFAKYRDHLMPVVQQQEFDERAVRYQGSIEQMNDMDFQRLCATPRPHPYDQRFEEIKEEREITAKTEAFLKKPPTTS